MVGDEKIMQDARHSTNRFRPVLLVLNQMAGPMTWELVEDLAARIGPISLLTGHPDTLKKGSRPNVRLVPSVAYKRGSLATRFWRWLCYSMHAVFWLLRQPKSTPILLFSNPPIGMWAVRVVHALRGTPYAVMVHDIFPDVLVRKKVAKESGSIVRCWRQLNRWGYRSAAVVMTLGVHMSKALRRHDVTPEVSDEIVVIPPWADDRIIQPYDKQENDFATEHGQTEKLTCMYSGNMGLGHDLESMCEAALEFEGRKDIGFMFIGAGPKWEFVNEFQRKHSLKNTIVLGWQPEEVVPHSLATADIGMVSLERELSGLAVPSKAFYFLAANVPLIAVCDQSTELADLVREYECGVVVPPGNPEMMVEAIERVSNDRNLLKKWKSGAMSAMRDHRREAATRRFAEVLCQRLPIK